VDCLTKVVLLEGVAGILADVVDESGLETGADEDVTEWLELLDGVLLERLVDGVWVELDD